jgi:hypothetical protein
MTDGSILTCYRCGGEELFEDGRFYCYGWCNEKTSGSGEGEASGPDPAS